ELDCGRTLLCKRPAARPLCRVTDCVAADVQRWVGRRDSTERRIGSLEAGRVVRFVRPAGGLDVSLVCSLGMGRRVARPTRYKLRIGTRLPRWRWREHDSGCRRTHGIVYYLDIGPPPRQVFEGWHPGSDSWTQRRAG